MGAHERVVEGMVQAPGGARGVPGDDGAGEPGHGSPRPFKQKSEYAQTLERVFELFPRLAERRKQVGGTMSGGDSRCWRSAAR